MASEADNCAEVHGSAQSDEHPEGYGNENENRVLEPHFRKVAIVRVPLILLESVADMLEDFSPRNIGDTLSGLLPLVWMVAIAGRFPDTSLNRLRARFPSLLPAWLLQGFAIYEVRISEGSRLKRSPVTVLCNWNKLNIKRSNRIK